MNALRKLPKTHFEVVAKHRQPTGHARFGWKAFQLGYTPAQYVVALLKLIRHDHPGVFSVH